MSIVQIPEGDVWKSFTKLDHHFVKCNFCSVKISILRTPEENMTRHLEKKHSNQSRNLSNLTISLIDDTDDEEKMKPSNISSSADVSLDNTTDVIGESETRRNSLQTQNDLNNVIVRVVNGDTVENIVIWKHYVHLDNGSAMCGHCSKMVDTSKPNYLTKLVLHLKEKHDGMNEPVIMNAIENYKKLHPNEIQVNSGGTSEKPKTVTQATLESTQMPHIPKTFWKHFEYWKNHAKCLYCAALISLTLKEGLARMISHLLQKHKIVVEAESAESPSEFCSSPLEKRPNETIISEPPPLKIIKVTSAASVSPKESDQAALPKLEPIDVDFNVQFMQPQEQYQPDACLGISKIPEWNGKITDEMILKMIVKGYHNFKIIEETGFQSFIKNADPSYILPATGFFGTEILSKEYESMKLRIFPKLQESAAVTLSVEEFEVNDNRLFIEFKIHFIDRDCRLQSNTLNCFQVDPNETGDLVSNRMNQTLLDWKIMEKLVTTISSNTQTMKKIMLRNKRIYLPCFYNFIEIMAVTSFNEIKSILNTVRQVVTHFITSTHANNEFLEVQRKITSIPQKLLADEPNNWISTFDMMIRLLDNKIALQLYQSTCFLPELIDSEWILLDHVCKILRIFKIICVEMATEKYSSLSKVIIYIDAIKQYINKYTTSQITLMPVEISQITSNLATLLDSYKITYLHLEATLLDPRFKKQAFKDSKHYQLAYESVCRLANSIVLPEDNELVGLPTDTESIWYEWDIQFATEISVSRQNKQKGKDELDKYLLESLVDRKYDPLQWWATRKVFYPRLYQIVLNRLCIVASAVPSSRLVIPAEKEVIVQRRQLTERNVSKIVFLNGNYD